MLMINFNKLKLSKIKHLYKSDFFFKTNQQQRKEIKHLNNFDRYIHIILDVRYSTTSLNTTNADSTKCDTWTCTCK